MALEKQFSEEFDFMKKVREEERKIIIQNKNKEMRNFAYFTLCCATVMYIAIFIGTEIDNKGKYFYKPIRNYVSNLLK